MRGKRDGHDLATMQKLSPQSLWLLEESDNFDNDEKVGDNSIAQFGKLNELFREMELLLESLNLTPSQRKCLPSVRANLKLLYQAISEMDEAGGEEIGLKSAIK